MGVSTTTNRVGYVGDGATVSFSFPYYFFAQANLKVLTFNTVTGAIILKTLGVDYTISGTPDAQGRYTSGGSVVFGSAPASTIDIVIYRDPTQSQSYALLQNETINSVAIVQQMDYLTLLVQRLQDQATRSLHLAEGYAPAFSMVFPSDMSIDDNAVSKVPLTNDTGLGWADSADWPTADQINTAEASAIAAAASASAASASATAAAASATSASSSATAAAASAAAAAASAAAAITGGPFTIADSQAVAADITNLKFLTAARIATFAFAYTRGVTGGVARLVFYKNGAGTWVVAPPLEDGDPSGLTFTLAVSGLYQQVQYVSDNSGAGTSSWTGANV